MSYIIRKNTDRLEVREYPPQKRTIMCNGGKSFFIHVPRSLFTRKLYWLETASQAFYDRVYLWMFITPDGKFQYPFCPLPQLLHNACNQYGNKLGAFSLFPNLRNRISGWMCAQNTEHFDNYISKFWQTSFNKECDFSTYQAKNIFEIGLEFWEKERKDIFDIMPAPAPVEPEIYFKNIDRFRPDR